MTPIDINTLDISVGAIMPEITLAIFGLALILADLFPKAFGNRQLGGIAIAGFVATGFLCVLQIWHPQVSFFGMFVVDHYAIFFKLIALLGSAIVIMISMNYVEDQDIKHGEFYSLIVFATLGMLFLISANDLVLLFVGIETIAISSYLLAGLNINKFSSSEAAIKYFILGAFSSGFLLYGIVLLYGVTGSLNFLEIKEYFKQTPELSQMVWLGIAMLVIGLSFKVGLVPFHFWVPDVYEGAPTPITAFFSIGPKIATLAVFIRVLHEALASVQEQWTMLFWVLAAVTMTLGNIAAVFQTNIKRMLAYSSIAHAGYIFVAIVAGNELGIASIMFYLFAYIFMNLGAFAIVISLAHKDKEFLEIKDYSGLAFKHPFLAFAMAVFMLSLAGVPPTAGFIGKFYIFGAAIKSGYIILAVIAVINSVISVFFYMRVTVMMYMKQVDFIIKPKITTGVLSVLVFSVWGTLFFGIFPG
ncbi:MAG: NADH-quinone oxidoreductase subunit N, partial [Nitrospinae bacterium]|nr:NADH-quinone oxidoreductase subunit N [Nitrospinota bacterium]